MLHYAGEDAVSQQKNDAARAAELELYPNQANAAGVPLRGQSGEQAIKNFQLILSRLAPAERQAFERLRAQALAEAEEEAAEPLIERAVGEPPTR